MKYRVTYKAPWSAAEAWVDVEAENEDKAIELASGCGLEEFWFRGGVSGVKEANKWWFDAIPTVETLEDAEGA